MRLTKISLHNVKGRSMTVDLDPVTIISGPSRSGKSAVLLAIRWLLTGSMPAPYGKTLAGMWAAAPDGALEMRVSAETDDGVKLSRAIVRNEKDQSLSAEASVSDIYSVPEIMVDPVAFMAMGGPQRREYTMKAVGVVTSDSQIVDAAERAGVSGVDIGNPRKWVLEQRRLATFEESSAVAKMRVLAAKSPPDSVPTQDELSALERAYHDARQKAERPPATSDARHQRLESLRADIDRIASSWACCPLCRREGDGWKDAALAAVRAEALEVESSIAATAGDEQRAAGLQAEAEAALERWRNAAAKVRQLEEYNAARRDVLATEAAIVEARRKLERLRKLEDEVGDIEMAALRCAADRIIGDANAFAEGLMTSPLEFDECMDIGRRVSDADIKAGSKASLGAWVSHRSFSDSEKLVAYTALAFALSRHNKFRVVLLDELGRMDNGLLSRMTAKAGEMVQSGLVHQVIGVRAS